MEEDKKSKKRALILTALIQLLVFAMVYFMVVWQAPDPPNPEYGIELSFASFASSSSAGAAAAPKQPSAPPERAEEVPEEAIESAEPAAEAVEEAVAETVEGNLPDNVPTSEATSTQQQAPAETVEVPDTSEQTLPEESAASETTETVTEEVEEVVEETVDPMEYPNETQTVDHAEGEAEQGESVTPSIDARALYGNQQTGDSNADTSGGEGANLSLSGWVWDNRPDPEDDSDESGKIVYNIVVDADGYLVKIDVKLSTVSPLVERKYRRAVEKLTFSKTAEYQSAPVSKGTITFIIKTK